MKSTREKRRKNQKKWISNYSAYLKSDASHNINCLILLFISFSTDFFLKRMTWLHQKKTTTRQLKCDFGMSAPWKTCIPENLVLKVFFLSLLASAFLWFVSITWQWYQCSSPFNIESDSDKFALWISQNYKSCENVLPFFSSSISSLLLLLFAW